MFGQNIKAPHHLYTYRVVGLGSQGVPRLLSAPMVVGITNGYCNIHIFLSDIAKFSPIFFPVMYIMEELKVINEQLIKLDYEVGLNVDHPLCQQYTMLLDTFLYKTIDILGDPFDDIKERARNRIRQLQYEELYRLRAQVQPNEIQKEIQALRLSLGEKGEKTTPYIWLCVNPNPTVLLSEFNKTINKMITKKWLQSYVYVLEQRGQIEEEIGKGFHLHAIIKRPDDKKLSHCIRELSNTFKTICDVSNYHFFQTKFIDEAEKDRKMEYILGQKEYTDDNRKDLKQQMDKIWRERLNIQPYFFSNIELGKYATQKELFKVP